MEDILAIMNLLQRNIAPIMIGYGAPNMAAVFLVTLNRIPTLTPGATLRAGSGHPLTCVAKNQVILIHLAALNPAITAVRRTNSGESYAVEYRELEAEYLAVIQVRGEEMLSSSWRAAGAS
jgi:hypothetical protein